MGGIGQAKRRAGFGSAKLLCGTSLSAILLLAIPTAAQAQDTNRNWDANGTAVGNGSTGTWNTTNSTWSPNTDGVSGPYGPWDNVQIDNAIFGGAAGTVTLGTPITVHNITFNTANYTLTGNTLTLAGTTPTITVNSGTSTINSIIAGTAGLTKAGAGNLTLGGANTFSGGINVNAGTLNLSGASTFSGNVVVANTAQLNVSSDAALGAASNSIQLGSGSILNATGTLLSSTRVINLTGGATEAQLFGAMSAARITGTGNLVLSTVNGNMSLANDLNDFTGQIRFHLGASRDISFSSIADAGVVSSLGAATGAAATIRITGGSGFASYSGSGPASSNRDWDVTSGTIRTSGGTLTLTGNVAITGSAGFSAQAADMNVLGVISGGAATFGGTAGRTITLGSANTFTGSATVNNVTVAADAIANGGSNSSLGAGSSITLQNGGILNYTGTGSSSNRSWAIGGAGGANGPGGAILNDGSGALSLGGALTFGAATNNNLTLGGAYAGINTISGAISGNGNLVSAGSGTWVLTGTNTRTGTITVNGGTLRGGSASAFGTTTGITTTGGMLDLNGFNMSTTALAGTGGTLALGSANFTLTLGTGISNSYGGSIAGASGSLTKLGAGTLTLTGANTYTGATTIGGGTLALDFSPAGGATSNLISASSTLNMGGGRLNIIGAGGEANSQAFNGFNITGGSNTVDGSIIGTSLDVSFGAINRSAGLVNFVLPGSGSFTTSNADGALGGWATINGSDYAKVLGGAIVAFTAADYTNKDDASTWVANEILSDAGGAADTPFSGTVSGSVQIGGLQYTAAANSTVTVGVGNTLGVDGTIIVAPSVGGFNQTITGGSLTGPTGGGALGVQQNGTGTFTIASQIVDNGGATGFTKSGTGAVVLSGASSYTGATTVTRGTLSINSVANAGAASAIGAASVDSSNLLLQGATLDYTGATASTDRGFTITTNGAVTTNTINVTQAGSNLTFGGVVTSPDNASLIKTGPGTLTLSNAGNNYVGTTTVSGGSLAVSTLADGGAASSIGAASSASSNLVLQSGGELEYLGGTASTDRGFTLGTGGGAIDIANSATSLTISGTVAGTAGQTLTKNGTGTLILSGNNSGFSAGGFVNAGTLRAGSTQAFGTGGWTVAAGATLDLNNNANTFKELVGTGTVALGSARLTLSNPNQSFSGAITGTGGLTISGGTQTFTGCGNTYSGSTILQANSTVNVDCLADGGQPSGIGASGAASTNLVFNNGAVNYTGTTVTTNRGFQLLGGTGAIAIQNAGTTLTFTGVATGAGTLRVDGPGTLVLSGANTLTGATSIGGGVLRAGSATALGTGSMGLANVAGATLDLNNFDTTFTFLAGGGTLGGNILLGSANLTLNSGSTTRDYAGAISGSGGLIKGGSASFVQILSGCNSSYDGSTTINSGVLAVNCLSDGGVASSIGASGALASNLVISGGTLRYVGTGGSTNRLFTLGASATSKIDASGTGGLSFANTGAIAFSSPDSAQTIRLGGTNTGNNSFALQITNNGAGLTSLTKEDAGTWILTNQSSTYTGVTRIIGGVLGVDKLSDAGFASSIGQSSIGASNLVIGEGSTLRYTGSGDSTNRLFTLDKGVSFIESSGTGAIAFTNTGAVEYADAGQARVVALGGTNTGNNIMGASIGNSGAGVTTLAKNDVGTWTLTGTNTYTGPTNVNGGTLYIGNGGTTGSIQSTTANVTGGSTLGFNRSDAVSFAGTIAGAGAVQQLGTGTTTLTGTNSYTGGTTISAGTLQLGNGGATGSVVGNVTNNGTLAFNRNNTYIFAGTVSGTGALNQIGTGTTVLTATNTYTGGTTISQGTLQIGNGGTTGSIVGDVLSTGGLLSFRRSDTVNYSGTYSGTGGLTMTGGTLILTGNNSYSGTTVVATNSTIQVGNGGTTGSIASNVTLGPASSRLAFNRSDSLVYAGIISGASSASTVTQAGTGTTIFTGANSYAGATNVNAGKLLINGNQSGATGLTSVAGGATLGGTGTIGGNVAIADGGTLAAGSDGVGALTINGNLALGSTSQLAFEFGQANVPGGPLNDLVNVGGNLTLDGTVNVTQTAGGSFGPGVYRMFNYSGLLTDNGLTIGSLPSGTAFVQTALANQVNLVNTAGLTLNFWDGAAGPKNDGLIQGGNGTWRLAGGENNWTEVNGAVNADYAQDSFAIFQGTGGTVTVDNSGGNVLSSGMQFTADGYTITGGPLTLTGAQALVRVGDGSPADAGLTTTIDAVLAGSAQLVKDLGGTLVLTGANTYTGGTAINGGVLRVASDANLGDAAGALSLNGGTLNTTATFTSARTVDLAGAGTFQTDTGTTLALTGVVSGAGALTKDGAGALVLTNANTYAGGTTIGAGTLQLGSGGTTGSITGNVANNGTLAFNRSDSLSFAGTVTGSGTVSQIGSGTTILTADNSYTGGTTIGAGTLQLGNGGTTGGFIGDVVNNAALVFNRSNEVTFAGLISGTGRIEQAGSGTTILTASNSYAGTTTVGAGTLLINGDQSSATGATSVAAGATLGGTGTIGGDVTLASGATLAPGETTGPGTLTINGNLALAGTSLLDYEFGQSNVVGGSLNDLTQVGGDLTLDGTINVDVSAGGSFGPGLYRVISYGGALNNQGLDVGALPPGALVSVQTAIAGQVNLLNATGATLNFWDGSIPANDSNNLVDGGSGTWQNSSGNNDWANPTGQVNGPYSDGSFAIFAGAAGTVSIDNSLGAVTASGLQFASDGYTITGQDLTMVGPQSTIRVGDGTAAGLGYTGTINSAIVGGTQLIKADLGTLVLSGTNSYTGGTQIDAGTLRISSDANLGDAAGALGLNGGTLNTTADFASNRSVNLLGAGTFLTDANTTLILNGALSGAGGFTKSGTGGLVLTGTNSFAGDTSVVAGSLFVNGDQSAATGLTSIASGATLGGSGIIGGNVTIADGATLAAGTNGVGTLTVAGNLALGAGSVLDFEFGQANIAGGALNDLVEVGGNLVLDGTINVSVPASGSFGPGIYRAFNYGGTLTDNGLTLGTLPGGSAVSVQTAIAGQVNLVNTAGLTLSFWDGDAGPKNDGAVNGGNGVWRVGGGTNNWTDADGSPNADYAQNTFVIFAGAPGAVTVNNVGGNVLASGMQFASDGYTISGDALTLTGSQAIVQVGDGSAASAGYIATIASELAGSAGLVKTDAGTLILSGTNSYTGGTTIDGGTVRVSSDANLGDAAGGLAIGGGTLHTTAAIISTRAVGLAGDATFLTDAGLTLAGVVSGAGSLAKDGAGTLVLAANNAYTGGTTIGAGRLELGDGGTSGAIVGDVVNDGVLAFNRSDSMTFAGLISGGGAIEQMGTGTTILTANHLFTGGTTISAGTLQLGDGGTTGSITGDVLNNGTLAFNRTDTVPFAGLISGSGGVDQIGLGTTILSGANSYTGATSVNAGTLLVNGNQSAATGLTSIASGATLGGTGTIGGDVVVADGATLAPGAGGAGALTINGGLSLSSGSSLAYEFGRANAPGDPLNDVVNVGGDLTLDGTLNVAVTPGGAFDIGLYRIANYGGTLTDNGLALGTLPAGADVFVQSSVAGQVNLISVGGATLNFWDGAAGPKFNGAINGGDGTWQNSSGNDNWADATGAVNAGYDDGAFAIFTGAAGTVTIDDSLGAVTASGLQFATNGYTITGDALALTGPQSVIRVGDGTVGGAGYTATIASVITGSTQLVKTDLGTLVLTGANTYTGGTAINGGTVRVASDASLGAAAGGLSLNGGTLNTTADLSSARAVALGGAGTFLTDAGTTLTLAGPVTGAGSLTKSGTGTLVLSGTGSHGGATNIGAGTLLVNGNYAGATGGVSIASGATLGGTGTIGGDVTFADGSTLTPGAGGAGTLTINGDLSLAAGTTLAYEFGAANVAGGALNDLVNVGGDLTLDGVINVTVPAGGAFDVGVYRVFNYGGTLTNNGLGLGALPAGSDVDVQTSIAGQVNLVNSAGLTLNFWDGAAGPKNNGAINGGNGTWQNSTGNDNWTDASGNVNAAFSDSAFAVFGGTGGTVTVDNGLGQVTVAGMQFAANGYTIAGGPIALTGPQSVIRVGDGSTAGAGFTATISSVLSGDTQLVKTDAGTLVLGGTNSYSGGTLINGGTVQIAADANLGAAAGDVTLDGGTLATSANITSARDIVMAGAGTISTAANTVLTYNGLFSGTGSLTKAGAGTLLVTANNDGFAGSTAVTAGILAVQGSLGGTVNVAASGRLEGAGRVGSIVNEGVVAPGSSIGSLTVAGDYTSNGGALEIEAELGADNSASDRLIVNGATSGSTRVTVTNRGGLGAQTVEGIKIVDVAGASNGSFALDGDYLFAGEQAVIAGAYGYRLYKNGVATPQDGDWYLRSTLLNGANEPQGPLYQPGVPLYENYGQVLQSLNTLSTLQERVGNRQWSRAADGSNSGIWGRMESTRARPEARVSTAGTDANIDSWKLQIGADRTLSETATGTLVAGITGHYGESSASVRSIFGDGTIKAKGYGAGATLTWYSQGGFYADAQAQFAWFDGQLKSAVLGTLVDGNDGTGKAFSLELGKRAIVGGGLTVTPQVQMSYQDADFDSFTDPSEAQISSAKGDSLKTRWGISLDHQKEWESNGTTRRTHLYGLVNLSYEWLDGTEANVSGTAIRNSNDRLWGEIALGGSLGLNDRVTIYAQASASSPFRNFGDDYSIKGVAGVRVAF